MLAVVIFHHYYYIRPQVISIKLYTKSLPAGRLADSLQGLVGKLHELLVQQGLLQHIEPHPTVINLQYLCPQLLALQHPHQRLVLAQLLQLLGTQPQGLVLYVVSLDQLGLLSVQVLLGLMDAQFCLLLLGGLVPLY